MTQIHFLKTWYDQLFYRNKVDIIKLIAKDYGYKIIETDYDPDYMFLNSLKKDMKLKKEEIIEVSKKIFFGEKVDDKYKYYIDNLREQVKMREKYLHNINDIDKLCELVSDHTKFINYINRKYLELSKSQFEKKLVEINNNDILQIIKDNDIVNKINVCFWFEELFKINRLEIEKIEAVDLEKTKKILHENTERFFYLFKNNECKNKTIKSIKHKIDSIINVNYLQKFIAECYNCIVEDRIKIKYKQIKINKILVGKYSFILL